MSDSLSFLNFFCCPFTYYTCNKEVIWPVPAILLQWESTVVRFARKLHFSCRNSIVFSLSWKSFYLFSDQFEKTKKPKQQQQPFVQLHLQLFADRLSPLADFVHNVANLFLNFLPQSTVHAIPIMPYYVYVILFMCSFHEHGINSVNLPPLRVWKSHCSC